MKFQITKNIDILPARLFAILQDTSVRKNWIPIFVGLENGVVSLVSGASVHSKYSFLKEEACIEEYFRVVDNKEIALTIDSSKGKWTVFVVLVETNNGTEVTAMVELESRAWLSSLMLWMEAGKLELFANELLDRLKEYAEKHELHSVK